MWLVATLQDNSEQDTVPSQSIRSDSAARTPSSVGAGTGRQFTPQDNPQSTAVQGGNGYSTNSRKGKRAQ